VYTTFFSRFASYKRPDLVLDLAKNFPEQKFLLMGGVRSQLEGYYLSLLKRAERDSLVNVTFMKTPPEEKVRSMLAKTLVYVFPGINEHFGMATVEAIASGAIPFVHDSGGQQEIVPDSRLRFTDDTFRQKYDDLLHLSPAEQNAIRRALHEHIQQYSEQVFIDKMLSYLEPVIESDYLNEVQTTTDR
jgi:glycosyltransferase involved in cell wall biosynthesis